MFQDIENAKWSIFSTCLVEVSEGFGLNLNTISIKKKSSLKKSNIKCTGAPPNESGMLRKGPNTLQRMYDSLNKSY